MGYKLSRSLKGGIRIESKPTAASEGADTELHIRLDLAGLAALMKAIEGAMAEVRGGLPCDGIRVTSCGFRDALRTLTLVWRAESDDEGELYPAPLPQTGVLETLS